MKIMKTILLVILVIIVLFLLIALFVKKDFSISREVTINKPKEDVFNYVKLIKNQEKYSVWVMKDPNIKLLYAGVDGTVGFTSSWTSEDKNVGVGAQEIIAMGNDNIKVEIRFKKPFEATNYATTTVETVNGNQTKLVTTFTGRQKYPMNMMNLFMGKLIGNDMQTNLDNVKKNLEN